MSINGSLSGSLAGSLAGSLSGAGTGDPDAVAGTASRLWYQTQYTGYGTAGFTVYDLVGGNDIGQATVGNQPAPDTVSGYEGWLSDASTDAIGGSGFGTIIGAGGYADIWAVVRSGGTGWTYNDPFELDNGVAAQFWLALEPGFTRWSANAVTGAGTLAVQVVDAGYSSVIKVLHGRLTSAGISLDINGGTPTTTATANGGLSNAITGVQLCNALGVNAGFKGHVFEAFAAEGLDSATANEITANFKAKYGI